MSGTNFSFHEDFEGAPAKDNATYRDRRGHRCAHELGYDAFDKHLAAHQHGFRAVAGDQRTEGCSSCSLGFNSFYVDTLGADGSEAFHTLSGALRRGAYVGVERAPTGDHTFGLRMENVKGLVLVCSKPLRVSGASVVASASVYVAPSGWQTAEDELRVYAEIRSEPNAHAYGISLLPNCTSIVTNETVDAFGLRSNSSAAVFGINGTYADTWEVLHGRPLRHVTNAPPSDAVWKNLSVALGRLDASQVRVCVGMQSLGEPGAPAVFVNRLQLSGENDGVEALAPACAPSPRLVGVDSLKDLAVPGSCGMALDPVPLSVLVVLISLCIVGAIGSFLIRTCSASGFFVRTVTRTSTPRRREQPLTFETQVMSTERLA